MNCSDNYKVNKMVKSRKNNLHLEVSNDVDLEYETASTTSRRSKKTNRKDKALTKTKKVSLKAKPKKTSSFLVVNGKKIPFANSKKSRRNKMSSKTKGAKKASSAAKKPSANDKNVSFDVKEEKAEGSNSLQSSSTGSESSGTKTIYMPIKQEANGQTAEAIIVEDKKKVDLQDVKLVEAKTEKKD